MHEINISQQSQVSFEWNPGHSKIPGNDQAHLLAQNATKAAPAHTKNSFLYPLLQSVALAEGRKLYLAPRYRGLNHQPRSLHIESAKPLPGKHTEKLYRRRTKTEASVLCQLRSGMCRLNGYLAKIGVKRISANAALKWNRWITSCSDVPYG